MYPASILSYYVVTLPISLQQYANLLLICRLVHSFPRFVAAPIGVL